jgi:hypothetical protein
VHGAAYTEALEKVRVKFEKECKIMLDAAILVAFSTGLLELPEEANKDLNQKPWAENHASLEDLLKAHRYLTLLMARREPKDRELFFRNMGHVGDTPGFRPHPSRASQWAFPGAEKFHPDKSIHNGQGFFATPDQWLTHLKADTIVGFFGYNESFDGPSKVGNFEAELDAATVVAGHDGPVCGHGHAGLGLDGALGVGDKALPQSRIALGPHEQGVDGTLGGVGHGVSPDVSDLRVVTSLAGPCLHAEDVCRSRRTRIDIQWVKVAAPPTLILSSLTGSSVSGSQDNTDRP